MDGYIDDSLSQPMLAAGSAMNENGPHKHAKTNSQRRNASMPLAIVGMACRLPGGVSSTDDLWQLCALQRSGWSEIPSSRFTHKSYYHPDAGKLGTYNAKGGHFLQDDVGFFDAAFFNITTQEAVAMDPQQRLLLECTYEALESGGITKQAIAGTETGVFVGGTAVDYEHLCFKDIRTSPMYSATGCQPSILANRLSHYFDLRGPSLTIDTMCSSSLMALHIACQSLRSGEISQAIVGGAHLNLSPDHFISMSNQRLFGSEGKCFSFDHRAKSGYGRGEGVGCIVVKPLEDALAAQNSIRAVILSSGSNQDGRTDGITFPNQQAQEDLIRSVYHKAGLDTKDTGFVEAHGTGTRVGDPIEAAALHEVFGRERSLQEPLFIGSVKSNIGHLEGASGIISIIKAALCLEKGFVLPNCHFELPNPSIPLSRWNLKVPVDQRPWPRSKKYASVNNFGFGGANCHVVLEKAPQMTEGHSRSLLFKTIITGAGKVERETLPKIVKPWMQHLYILSAHSRESLEDQIKKLEVYLEQRPEVFEASLMRRLAYTLCERRSLLPWRVATSACTAVELISRLTSSDQALKRVSKKPNVGYVFTGQGAQWHAMGRELIAAYPVFASTMCAAANVLTACGAEWSLVGKYCSIHDLGQDILTLSDELSKDANTTRLDIAHISQPACTALQIALIDLLESWGIRPVAVAGHSSGEIAAAYAAGALSLESCMKVAYFRGHVTRSFKPSYTKLRGAMLAVGSDQVEMKPYLESLKSGKVVVAAINSPASLTVSGDEEAILELQHMLEANNIFNRKLRVDMAYHSHHMKLVAQQYLDLLAGITPLDCSNVDFYSTVTGTSIASLDLEPSYWVSNLISTVRFTDAMTNLCGLAIGEAMSTTHAPVDLLIEIGPHCALEGPVRQILKSKIDNQIPIEYTSCLVRNRNAVETSLQMAARLCVKGYPLDYSAVNFPFGNASLDILTDLDPYPWQHNTRYWHDSRTSQNHQKHKWPLHDLLGTLSDDTMHIESEWRSILRLSELPWLEHYVVQSNYIFPLSGYVSLALEAMNQRAVNRGDCFDSFILQNLSITNALILTSTTEVELRTTIRPCKEGNKTSSAAWEEFQVFSYSSRTGWLEHCQGVVGVRQSSSNNSVKGDQESQLNTTPELKCIHDQSHTCVTYVDVPQIYRSLAAVRMAFGEAFQGLESCQASSRHAVTEVKVIDTSSLMPESYESDYILHPSTLDAITQAMWPILGAGRAELEYLYQPASFRELIVPKNLSRAPGTSFQVYSSGAEGKPTEAAIEFSFFATQLLDVTQPVIRLEGYMMHLVRDNCKENQAASNKHFCHKLDWQLVAPTLPQTPQPTPQHQTNGVHHRPSSPISLIPDVSIITLEGQDISQYLPIIDAIGQYTGTRPTVNPSNNRLPGGKLLVVLIEMERPCLANMTSHTFNILRGLIMKASGVFWPVQGAYNDAKSPDVNMVSGFARTLRSETTLKFVTVDLDPRSLSSKDTARLVAEVFRRSFVENTGELEYMERGGLLHVPRIIPDLALSNFVRRNIGEMPIQGHIQNFVQVDRIFKPSIEHVGSLETLRFVDNESLANPLGPDEIEIEIKAISLNFNDVLIAMGQIAGGLLGQECSGVVRAVGTSTTNFKVGDRVCAISSGCLANIIRCTVTTAVCVPDQMSFEVAATLPIAYCTAYYSLLDVGCLARKEKVLIHAAAGGVGQAAIGLAQMVGAEVFATVGSASKKTFLMEKFGLPGDHIFYSRDTTFKAGIMRMTNNKGVDVVLNSLAGEALHSSLECLTAFGRFIDIGKRDIVENSRLMMAPFARNIVFASVDLAFIAAERPQLMQKLLSSAIDLYRYEQLRLVTPLTTFRMSEVESALRLLQGGQSIGKIVIVPRADDQVKALPPKIPPKLLHEDATYIIIGGNGGIGRSLAKWMATKGARHIVSVSRSGANARVEELIKELEAYDAKLVVQKCDVGDKDAVAALIKLIESEMPPIRGLIHSAMVLHDMLFENLAYEQYQAVIRPKVGGVWNLHHSLSCMPLDFFITLSSVSGIVGNKGQVAYAAANTFLDAFAQYRRSQGLPATAIDLAAVKDIGYLAENEDKAALVSETLGGTAVGEEELHVIVAAAIMGQIHEYSNGHCITGLDISEDAPMPTWMSDSKFEHLRPTGPDPASASQPEAIPLSQAISQATDLEEVQSLIQNALVDKVASTVGTPVDEIDPHVSITMYGLDSLTAIEIRNWISREFKANLQVLELLSSGSLCSLAKLILEKSKIVDEVPRLKEMVAKKD